MNRRAIFVGRGGRGGVWLAARRGSMSTTGPIMSRRRRFPDFERETGIRVRYGTYESIQEMLAKVMSGNSGWDVVFPSAEYIQPMREMGLLAPLRAQWLPNLDSLDASFRHPPWDPELRWNIPYMWGVTGIVYQSSVNPRSAGVEGSVQ